MNVKLIGLSCNVFRRTRQIQFRAISTTSLQCAQENTTPAEKVMIPPYEEKIGEPLEQRRARLLYQSRKRGMLENGLLLSTFAAKYLKNMNEEQIKQYDRLINLPSNDWDIFYWATGVKPTPDEFNNNIMDLFKDHIKNKDKLQRIRQPDLEFS